MIVIELTAATDAAGTLETLLVSDVEWATKPTDTPADTHVDGGVTDPGAIGVSAYGDGRTGGGSRLETGSIELANVDGRLDPWTKWGFEGRPVIIRSGPEGGAYPAAFTTILTLTSDGPPVATFETMSISLRDKSFILDKPLLSNRYAGNNALPAGREGNATDLRGRVKPRTYGVVENISPPLVNTSKLTFQVNDGAVTAINAVYMSGVALTFASDVANLAALEALTVAGGTYATCLALGLYRVAAIDGECTANVTNGAAAGNRTVAQLLKAVALDAGVPSGDISAADITALDALNSAEAGVYVDTEQSALEVMDMLATSIGAYYAFDRAAGLLRLGRLSAPTGVSPVLTLSLADGDILDIERRLANDRSLPVWSVNVKYGRSWTVQTSGLAGSVTALRRAQVANEYRTATPAEDATVKTQFLQAETLEVYTLLALEAAAAAEATRLLNLHKVPRSFYDVTVPLVILTDNPALKLMDEVELVADRFDMDGGAPFILTGIRLALDDEQAILTVWG